MLEKLISRFKPHKIVYWEVIGGYVNEDSESSEKLYYVYLKRNGSVIEKKVKCKEIYYNLLRSGGIAKAVPLFRKCNGC